MALYILMQKLSASMAICEGNPPVILAWKKLTISRVAGDLSLTRGWMLPNVTNKILMNLTDTNHKIHHRKDNDYVAVYFHDVNFLCFR